MIGFPNKQGLNQPPLGMFWDDIYIYIIAYMMYCILCILYYVLYIMHNIEYVLHTHTHSRCAFQNMVGSEGLAMMIL